MRSSLIVSITMFSFLLVANSGAMTLEEFRNLPDNRVAVRTSLGVRSARPLSQNQVEATLGFSATSAADNPLSWRIVSNDDPDYAFEKFVTPAKATVRKALDVEGPRGCAFSRFERKIIVMDLPVPMKEGKSYDFIAQGTDSAVAVGGHSAASFVFKGPAPEINTSEFDLAVLGLRNVESVGNGVLLLEFGPCFAPEAAKRSSTFSIIINGAPAKVVGVGRISKIDTYLPVGWPFTAIPMHEVFVQVEPKFKDGDRIEVKVDESLTTANTTAALVFNSSKTLSNSIKVNQVGYITDSPAKIAYLGRWMGSFSENKPGAGAAKANTASIEKEFWEEVVSTKSQCQQEPGEENAVQTAVKPQEVSPENRQPVMGPALAFDKEPAFKILSASGGEAVYSGKSRLIHLSGDPDGGVYPVDHSGENVYILDFTDFKKPGRYVISVEGVGRSHPFDIADDVYNKAFQIQGYGLFVQRCGIELKPPFSDWRRIKCHANGLTLTSQIKTDEHSIGKLASKIIYKKAGDSSSPEAAKLEKDPSLFARYLFNGDLKDATGRGNHLQPAEAAIKYSDADTKFFREGNLFGPTADDKLNGGKADSVSIDVTKGLTVSFWFYKDGRAKFQDFFSIGNAPAGGFALTANWGVPRLRVHYGSRSLGALGMKRISDGKWHHITAMLDSEEAEPRRITLYENGAAMAGDTVTGMGADVSGELSVACIKGEEAGGALFADFRIYSRALTPAEIKTLATPQPAEVPVKIDAYGGHHDAGDYNPRSHIDVAQKLMDAYEMAPQKFYDGQLNIPEKANGIPDILDEALWALRLWIGLQDADGGVRNGTESDGDPNFIQTAELDPKGDFAYAKDEKGSLIFAGAMAQASRLLRSVGKNDLAADYLQRAIRAYDWAKKNPHKFESKQFFGYHIAASRAYASAQLLNTTGEEKYNHDFKEVCIWTRNPDADVEDHGRYDMRDAAWAYAKCPDKVVDVKLREDVRKAIIAKADVFIRLSSPMAYTFIRHPYAPINWGTGAYQNWLSQVAQAYKMTGDEKYKMWMIRTCDNTLGANPLGRSYIVGLGSRTVRAPLHNSRYGQTGEVCVGQQVQGPVQKGDGYRVQETAYPPIRSDFAALYTFVDTHFSIGMDEGTVDSQAQSLAIFGLLLPDKK